MRVLLIGCVKSSAIFLEEMINNKIDVVGVVTKKESSFNSDYVDLGDVCRENRIDYIYVSNVNDSRTKEYITNKNIDILLCLGWSQLLDEELLEIPSIGSIGFHPAKLPYNRGRHPIIWALALGLDVTASSFFWMEKTADTGKVISQKDIVIDYSDDAMSLYQKIMEVAKCQLIDVLCDIEDGLVYYEKICEYESATNSWRKRGKKDGEIDWRMSGKSIYNLVRALTHPYIGAHFTWQDEEYKVWRVEECDDSKYKNIEPGKVLRVEENGDILIKTGDGLIKILQCDKVNVKEGDYL